MEANQKNETPVMVSETATGKSKMSKGQMIGMIVLTIVALAGVAFGVFGMMEKDKAEKNLAIKITEAGGKVTEIVTDKITSVSEDGTVTEITDTNVTTEISNPIVKAPSPEVYSVLYTEGVFIDANQQGTFQIGIIDGKVNSCHYMGETCNISGLPDNIYKLETIHAGNGLGNEKVGFIMADGSVYYMPVYDSNFAAKKLNINGFVKDIVTTNYCPQDPGPCSRSDVFVMADNSIVRYDEDML